MASACNVSSLAVFHLQRSQCGSGSCSVTCRKVGKKQPRSRDSYSVTCSTKAGPNPNPNFLGENLGMRLRHKCVKRDLQNQLSGLAFAHTQHNLSHVEAVSFD